MYIYIMDGREQFYMQITAGKQHRLDNISHVYFYYVSHFGDFAKKNIGLTNCTQQRNET